MSIGDFLDVFDLFTDIRASAEGREQIYRHWPEKIEAAPGEDASVSQLLSYRNHRIHLHGREKETEALDAFLSQETPVSIWAVVGEAGSGKSKFAYEAVSEFVLRNLGWKKLWWQAGDGVSPEWTEDDFPDPLIVVVDYVGLQSEELREQLTRLGEKRRSKLRILLLERENVSQQGQPSWLKNLLKASTGEPYFQRLFYGRTHGTFTSTGFLTLPPLSEKALRDILRDYWGAEDKAQEDRVLETAEKLTRKGESITPLHLLMAASVGEDFQGREREALLRVLLDKEKKRWQRLCGEGEPLIRKLLLFATLTGHWDMDSQVPALLLTEEERESAERFFREHPHRETLFGELGGSNEQHDLSRLMPDLLGEYFALKELSFLSTKKRKALSGELWQGEETRKGYYDFLYRAISDYPQHGVIKEALEPLPDDEDKAGLLNNFGKRLDGMGAYREAMKLHERALVIRLRVLGEDHPDTARSYNNLGAAYARVGQYMEAIGLYTKALDIQKRVLGEGHLDTAGFYNNLGNAYAKLGQYGEAIELYKKALVIRLRVLGEDNPDTAASYNNLGAAYVGLGEYEKAIEQLENALEIYLRLLGEDHPDTAMTYNNLGVAYADLGEYEKAIEQHEKALEIRLRVLGEAHPDTAMSYNNLGNAYYGLGQYEVAKDQYEKALKIYLRVWGEDHPDIAGSYNNLGNAYYGLGEYEKAKELYEKALEIRLHVLGEAHPDTVRSYNNLGNAYADLGEYEKAIEQHKKAFPIFHRNLGINHPYTRTCFDNIFRCAEAMGDNETAERYGYFAEHGCFPEDAP